jgi:hypothetical protein
MKSHYVIVDTLGQWDMNGLMQFTNRIEETRVDAIRVSQITSKDHTADEKYHIIVKAHSLACVNAWLVRTKLNQENPQVA